MYADVLVPTDGRESTGRAIDEAITLTSEQGATLHALYVVNSARIEPGLTSRISGPALVRPVTAPVQAGGRCV